MDTALNIALEAIDRLKVTASSHHRAFLVEVVGRKCGYLGLMAGLAGGADAIVGGAPTAFDRILATRLGAAAVDHLFEGKNGILVEMQGAEITATPLSAIVGKKKPLKIELFHLARSLAK